MAKYFDFSLTVWVRVTPCNSFSRAELPQAVSEHLELGYAIENFEQVEDSDFPTEVSFCFQLSTTLDASQVNTDEEPSDEAIEELSCELAEHLEQEFNVTFFEILDDAPSSVLLDSWEE